VCALVLDSEEGLTAPERGFVVCGRRPQRHDPALDWNRDDRNGGDRNRDDRRRHGNRVPVVLALAGTIKRL
jgi:hypothetical protein